MNLNLTRRRFGQLVIGVSSLTALGILANKSFGQVSSQVLYGVSIDYKSNPVGKPVILSLDLTTGQLEARTSALFPDSNSLTLESRERLTDLTFLSDGTPILGTISIPSGKEKKPKRNNAKSRSKKLTISGLNKETIESWTGTQDGSLLALISQSNSTPPYRLANVDPKTGKISFLKFTLPENQRFGTLVQCSDGRIYATSTGQLGETSLVSLDLKQGVISNSVQLNVNGTAWDSGLRSLACSPTGQLFALGAPRYEFPNSLFTVDPNSGGMTFSRELDVLNIAFQTFSK